jgi:hypothetical protein
MSIRGAVACCGLCEWDGGSRLGSRCAYWLVWMGETRQRTTTEQRCSGWPRPVVYRRRGGHALAPIPWPMHLTRAYAFSSVQNVGW